MWPLIYYLQVTGWHSYREECQLPFPWWYTQDDITWQHSASHILRWSITALSTSYPSFTVFKAPDDCTALVLYFKRTSFAKNLCQDSIIYIFLLIYQIICKPYPPLIGPPPPFFFPSLFIYIRMYCTRCIRMQTTAFTVFCLSVRFFNIFSTFIQMIDIPLKFGLVFLNRFHRLTYSWDIM